MKAIVCKYLGPTNTKGSRIKVTANGVRSMTVGIDNAHSVDENMTLAAMKLCAKYGWSGDLARGGLPNGDTVFVFKG